MLNTIARLCWVNTSGICDVTPTSEDSCSGWARLIVAPCATLRNSTRWSAHLLLRLSTSSASAPSSRITTPSVRSGHGLENAEGVREFQPRVLQPQDHVEMKLIQH